MPKYTYFCPHCEKEMDISHAMNEKKTVCPVCEKEGLAKQLSAPNVITTSGKRKISDNACPMNGGIPRCSGCDH